MQPYTRQPLDIAFGVFAALSLVTWCSSIALLIGIFGGLPVPMPLFNFAATAAATVSVVAAIIWACQRVCEFAASGRTDLLNNLDSRIDAKVEVMKWENFSDVVDTVLCENDPAEGGA